MGIDEDKHQSFNETKIEWENIMNIKYSNKLNNLNTFFNLKYEQNMIFVGEKHFKRESENIT